MELPIVSSQDRLILSSLNSLLEYSVVKIAVSFAGNLSEEDIPGASLEGINPLELNNDGLWVWLKCKGGKCKGLKTTGLNKATTSLKGEYLKGHA